MEWYMVAVAAQSGNASTIQPRSKKQWRHHASEFAKTVVDAPCHLGCAKTQWRHTEVPLSILETWLTYWRKDCQSPIPLNMGPQEITLGSRPDYDLRLEFKVR
mmetsp:Transcript_19543/g.34681  ORF Transcript_19543/g.34681 Transcript_19543/m.34681 type:complete len:103 (-) Transcript_19543:535-843(-)